jgi:hypothetical protein
VPQLPQVSVMVHDANHNWMSPPGVEEFLTGCDTKNAEICELRRSS